MAQLNTKRLQFLISTIFALALMCLGGILAMREFPNFSERYINTKNITELEKYTGKTFDAWQKERVVYCAKEPPEFFVKAEGLFTFNFIEVKDQTYSICMSVPAYIVIPDTEVWLAFLEAGFVYLLASVVLVWFISFVLVKAISKRALELCEWLKTKENKS